VGEGKLERENQWIFVDKMNADLLGGTESVLGLEERRRRFEGMQRGRDARGKLRYPETA